MKRTVALPNASLQKAVVSEATVRGWPLAAIDIRKAFLKGISYDELARLTGEPRREVNFELTKPPLC